MKEKKKKQESGQDLCPGRELSKGKGSFTLGTPFTDWEVHWTDREPQRRAQQPACGRQDRGRPAQTVHATLLHFPAQDTCLLVCGAAGGWNSGFRGLTLAAQRQPEGLGVWSGARLGVLCAGWSPGLLSTCV